MARPARPEQSKSARSSRQFSRFYHSINPDRVFGTHSLRGLEIDDQLEFGLLENGDVSRISAFEDFIHEVGNSQFRSRKSRKVAKSSENDSDSTGSWSGRTMSACAGTAVNQYERLFRHLEGM